MQCFILSVIVYFAAVISGLSCTLVSADNLIQQSQQTESSYVSNNSPWLFFNSDTGEYECYKHVTCTEEGAFIHTGHCITYDEESKTLLHVSCPFLYHNLSMTGSEHIKLPNNFSGLNRYMCEPLNRKGSVCSECIDGFGPSMTSLGYKCCNCTGKWHGISLYLLLEFGPTTLFYVIVLVFQISFTSSPMTGFIMYCQIILYEVILHETSTVRLTLDEGGPFPTLIQVIVTFYGIWNLDLLWFVAPPFCVSNKFKLIHLLFLRYICTFYPFFLIMVTWICIELHDHNFRPLVKLWSPFHRCIVHLRRSWNAKNDIIGVFSSFFLLSCSKLVYQAIVITLCHNISIANINTSVNVFESVVSVTEDLSVECLGIEHLTFSIISLVITILFVLLPTLILVLYPTRVFRRCLSRCRLGGRPQTALFIFVEKFHSCYRDSLDGGKDMRSFSGIHFLLRFFCFVGWRIFFVLKITYHGSFFKILGLAVASVIVAYIKPYKKSFMNIVDVLLLSYTAIFFHITNIHSKKFSLYKLSVTVVVYLFVPMIVFIGFVSIRLFSVVCHKAANSYCSWKGSECLDATNTKNVMLSKSHQSLIQPITVSHTSYGSNL